MADRMGQQLGNYRLVRLLGQGGFAEVYLGEHIHLGTEAAIKLLHTQLAGEDTDAFRTEARTIARLVHPHIVRVFDFGIEGETPYLVMDYAPNSTVRKRHPKGVALPFPTILSYVKQVADALQYAHDEHFVHRDIKPENLLMGRRQEVLLSDFGIALIAQTSRSQSIQDVAGTASYMAPEQFQGKPRPASDQYALAVMVYEWLTGTCPFHGSFTEVASQHLFVPPPPLREKRLSISPMVEQVVMTALAKDPHQRFGSVQAFATAFEQAGQVDASLALPTNRSLLPSDAIPQRSPVQPPIELATSPSESVAPTELITPPTESAIPHEHVTPPSQTSIPTYLSAPPNQISVPTEVAIPAPRASLLPKEVAAPARQSAALPTEAALSSWPSAVPPVLPLSPTVGTVHRICNQDDTVRAVAWSPDSKYIISAAGMVVGIWEVASGRTHFTQRSVSYTVAWSPDSTRFVFGQDSSLLIYEASTLRKIGKHRKHSNMVWAMAWSPDSTQIASCGRDDKEVQVWDAITGKTRLTYRGHSKRVEAITWAPYGTHISSASEDETVQVWEVVRGGTVWTNSGYSLSMLVAWSPDGRRITISNGRLLWVCNAATGERIFHPWCENPQVVNAVAWSPNSRQIACACQDKTVQVWDAVTGKHLFTYSGHTGPVKAVAWSFDGSRIASGSDDKTLQVWQAL